MDDAIIIDGIDFDEMDTMGGSSQVECYLSQYRKENDNDVVNGTQTQNTYYKEYLPLFEKW